METNSHVLAIVQVFEDYIDLDTDALIKEVDQSHIKKNNDNEETFFEDYKYPKTPMLQDLKQTIHTKAESIMCTPLQYEDIWIHKIPHRASTALHNHAPALCSFVYYPKFIKKQGDLRFILFWNGQVVERYITPQEKMLLIFPSEVFHYTSQNDTDIERVSISGNFHHRKV